MEGILPESGIIKMHREILQHQAKRRRRILKIVDKECGNSLKRLQFLAAHNLPRKSKVQQTRCDLVPDAFQQIQFLDRVWHAPDTVRQNGNAKQAISCAQRNTNAVTSFAELSRTNLPQGAAPVFLHCFQIKGSGKPNGSSQAEIELCKVRTEGAGRGW